MWKYQGNQASLVIFIINILRKRVNYFNFLINLIFYFFKDSYRQNEGDEYYDEDYEEDYNENNETEATVACYQDNIDMVHQDSQIEMEENDCDKLKDILNMSHELAQMKLAYGSSTVCLLSLEFYDATEFSLLSSANVGDSGYMLIRDKKVIFKTQSQSHRYNAPYQLGCTPPELIEHHLYRDK